MARKDTGETAVKREVWYAPDGGEYPVNADTLTPVEVTDLRSRGYSTTKPKGVDAEDNAGQGSVASGGPLSGAAE